MTFDNRIKVSQPPLNVDNSRELSPKLEGPLVIKEATNQLSQNNTKKMIEKDDVENAISSLNDFIKPIRKNIKFELHEKLERYYVTVIDSDTKEVLKEIPPKKLLDMYAEMADFMGFLIDKKV